MVEVLVCRWLARRNWEPATTRITIAAGIASLVGPACAALPYTDYHPVFLSSRLAVVWLLAAIGPVMVINRSSGFECKGGERPKGFEADASAHFGLGGGSATNDDR
jgi:hypothetical protein